MGDQFERFSRAVIDSMSAHVAILDERGVILDVNRAWKDFELANSNLEESRSVGMNYLEVCDTVIGPESNYAKLAAAGIRSVLSGKLDEFVFEYPCHSPDRKRWFNMRVDRLIADGPTRLVVSHENVTNVKLAEEELRKQEAELEEKTRLLTEANAALRAILKQRDEDKARMEESVTARIRNLILPYIDRLEEGPVSEETVSLLEIIRYNLEDVVSPFARKLSSNFLHLTPAEIQVADLVRQGRTSKEIAQVLAIAPRTVNFHRENLRRKLGLSNTPANLRTHLLTYE